jgi:sigma-70-like protein
MRTPYAERPRELGALGDAELVRLALQRNGAAFRLIMQRHNQRLYRVARSVVQDDSEAEDVVQEAYVRAYVEETADFLGLPPATVKSRLHRARRQLRRILDDQLVSTLNEAFPFDGRRCQKIADEVIERLQLA